MTTQAGGASSSGSFSDHGVKTLDGGLLGSLRWSKSIVPLVSFLVDLRFKLGLSNLTSVPISSTSGFTTKTRESELLVGASIGL
ncbi:MAG: hypothetical protein AAB425_09790 [Bdellovibrionota bacterium]